MTGRYAPSPTGPLHMGNLRTALLAWLHARLQGGQFYLRMDDLDKPRTVAGSADQILRDLEWLGLDWDGEVLYQSQRVDVYQDAYEQLSDQGLIYPCFCSRKDVQQCGDLTQTEQAVKHEEKPPAARIRVAGSVIEFTDGCSGVKQENLSQQCGDFVIKRADGLFAYQLAIVVDDMEQGITDVVRGADLLESTARQLFLMQQLQPDFSAPHYWHVPLMLDAQGERLAKRDGAKSIIEWQAEGRDQNQLLAYLAHSVDLIDQTTSISVEELLVQVSLSRWIEALKTKTP
ncbi:UNVERIFIED_CONTAM: hypothetical protein GTU68_007861 [Idotea baltica]|nr:hypothetical protein [Idotea baltica]